MIIHLMLSSALAGPIYERRGGEVLSQHLAEQLKEAYMSEGCLDFKALGVIQGEQCWILYVDVLVCSWLHLVMLMQIFMVFQKRAKIYVTKTPA